MRMVFDIFSILSGMVSILIEWIIKIWAILVGIGRLKCSKILGIWRVYTIPRILGILKMWIIKSYGTWWNMT